MGTNTYLGKQESTENHNETSKSTKQGLSISNLIKGLYSNNSVNQSINLSYQELLNVGKKLEWIGYEDISVISMDKQSKKEIKRFQKQNQLKSTGLIDQPTFEKIEALFVNTFSLGGENEKVIQLKRRLNRLGFGDLELTPIYDHETVQKVTGFQKHFNLKVTGAANLETIQKIEEILNSPLQVGNHHSEVINLKNILNEIGYGRIKVTDKYGKLMKNKIRKFQSDYSLPVSGIADEVTVKKINYVQKYKEKIVYMEYDFSLDESINIQQKGGVTSEESELRRMIDPSTYIADEKEKFIFLDLMKPHVVEADVLDAYLEDKGVLFEGTGQQFIQVANDYNINEVYLVNSVMEQYQKEAGSINDIIVEVAKEMKDKYSKTNTFYNMLWNPLHMSQNGKACDSKVNVDTIKNHVEKIYNVYQKLDAYTLYLEVPIYKK